MSLRTWFESVKSNSGLNLLNQVRHRTRLRKRGSGFWYESAEVLEVRSLLSAGATAVHAAMHHAAIESPAAKQPPIFQGAVDASIKISGHADANGTGTVLVPHFQLSVGSKVTASFTFSFSDGGNPATIKGTFTGTVRQIDLKLPLTIYRLDATGGKMTLTEKVAGKTVKATATPTRSGTALVLSDTGFREMATTGTFSLTAKGGLPGKTIILVLSPAP
jgi:hypothetical protein